MCGGEEGGYNGSNGEDAPYSVYKGGKGTGEEEPWKRLFPDDLISAAKPSAGKTKRGWPLTRGGNGVHVRGVRSPVPAGNRIGQAGNGFGGGGPGGCEEASNGVVLIQMMQ